MKKKKLTVGDIKKLEPLAEVFEFKKYCRYLVVVPKTNASSLIVDPTGRNSREANAQKILNVLGTAGVAAVGVFLDDRDEIRILELQETEI